MVNYSAVQRTFTLGSAAAFSTFTRIALDVVARVYEAFIESTHHATLAGMAKAAAPSLLGLCPPAAPSLEVQGDVEAGASSADTQADYSSWAPARAASDTLTRLQAAGVSITSAVAAVAGALEVALEACMNDAIEDSVGKLIQALSRTESSGDAHLRCHTIYESAPHIGVLLRHLQPNLWKVSRRVSSLLLLIRWWVTPCVVPWFLVLGTANWT